MELRDIARVLAAGRVGLGLAFALAPGPAGERLWLGPDARRRPVKLAMRALGGRDVALGLGVLFALGRDAPVRGWLEAAALADGVDTVATLLAGDSIPEGARRGALLVAGGSAVGGVLLARALGESDA